MATGKPAIGTFRGSGTLRAPEVRELQTLIDSIRERLRAAEAEVNEVVKQAGQNTFNATQSNNSVTQIANQIAALQTQLNVLATQIIGPDSSLAVVGNRIFAPHIPLRADPVPQEAATILAGQIFGD